MQFIYPEFLFALSVLAIPIIIHLFNFRRFKKVFFTNVRFLREIKQDTQSRSRLKHLLILFSRLLALTFLVLAFAQPFIPARKNTIQTGSKRVSIFVDNSFSMDALGTSGNLIEIAKKKAREIASAYKPSDEFQLLTTSFEGRHQRLVNRDEFLSLVDEIKPTSSVHSLSEILQRQQDALFSNNTSKTSKTAYIISDFQKSISDIDKIKADSTLQISFVPVAAASVSNLYIDTCFLSTPFVQLNTPNELVVRIKNIGEKNAENVPLKLLVNNSQKAVSSISVNSNSSTEVKLSFTVAEAGWQRAQISLADYPVTFDDNFFFSFNVRRNLNVLCINNGEPSTTFNAIFGNDPYFILKNANANQIDYSSFPSMQLIIVNELSNLSSGLIQELEKYVKKGGAVFLIPPHEGSVTSYNDFLNQNNAETFGAALKNTEKVDKIETKHPLFSGVFEKGKSLPENLDLPIINNYYQLKRNPKSSSDVVMRLASGNAYLLASIAGKGEIYMLASSLQKDDGNFARHALFVPIMLRAALKGSSEILPPLVIGRDHDISISDTLVSADNVFHMINKKENFDIIPESKILNNTTVLSVHDQIKTGENYDLIASNNLINVVSFNFDRKESDLSVNQPADLETEIAKFSNAKMNVIESEGKDLSYSIAQLNEGKRLWKYCIILTLIFLAIEILLIRFFRK
jgi:hypothetical protein